MRQSDVGLDTYVREARQALPNRLFDHMALGLPIINSLKGEWEDLLEIECIGIQYEAETAHSLKEAMSQLYFNPQKHELMGNNARRWAEERFDKNKTYPEIEEFFAGRSRVWQKMDRLWHENTGQRTVESLCNEPVRKGDIAYHESKDQKLGNT